MTYPMEPLNSTSVLEAIRRPSLRGYLVDKSVPFDAVDLPLVDYLPKVPKDRTEVNLVVGSGVTRMLYRNATGTWTQIGAAPLVTTLPTTTTGVVDGMLVSYVADDTNGVEWLLRYDSTEATYKWHFVGGPPMSAQVATGDTTASATYAALANAGPSITLPLAGDYDVSHGAMIAPGAAAISLMSYDIAATAAIDGDACRLHIGAVQGSVARTNRRTPISAAATALVSKYRTTAGTATFQERWIQATPVRVI